MSDDGSTVPPNFARTLQKEAKRYDEWAKAHSKNVAFGIMMRRYGDIQSCGRMWVRLGRDEWPEFKYATTANQAIPRSPYPRVDIDRLLLMVGERRFDLTPAQAVILQCLIRNPQWLTERALIDIAKKDNKAISSRPAELIRKSPPFVHACVFRKKGPGGGLRICTIQEWELEMRRMERA